MAKFFKTLGFSGMLGGISAAIALMLFSAYIPGGLLGQVIFGGLVGYFALVVWEKYYA